MLPHIGPEFGRKKEREREREERNEMSYIVHRYWWLLSEEYGRN